MADVQMMRHFIFSHPSITQNHGMNSVNVLLYSPDLPSSVTLVLLFLKIFIHLFKLRC
jgi:hypothetical protein